MATSLLKICRTENRLDTGTGGVGQRKDPVRPKGFSHNLSCIAGPGSVFIKVPIFVLVVLPENIRRLKEVLIGAVQCSAVLQNQRFACGKWGNCKINETQEKRARALQLPLALANSSSNLSRNRQNEFEPRELYHPM